MATRCATEVTIVDQTDATAVRCWYQMSASATLPAKPTTTDASATPAGWTRSEPTISSAADAAKYVYSCWQTVWGDGTCDWGDVSMSASFEASKRAWNLANSASTAATNAQNSVDNLQIGGRNLLTGTGDWSGSFPSSGSGSASGDTFTFSAHTSLSWYSVSLSRPYMPFSDVDGQTLTLGFDYRSDDFSDTSGDHYIWINAAASATETGSRTKYRQISTSEFDGVFVPTTEWQRGSITFDVSEALFNAGSGECNYFYIQFYNHTLNSLQLRHVKLERGTKATDWTPAPEDTDASIAAVQDNLNATRAWYAECPTAAGTAAKVATITPATTDFALSEGVTVAVKFTYANAVASPTLNVNGTGVKDIKRYGTTAPSTSAASSWNAGNVVTLVYDGTYWQMANWLNNNDNYYDRENYKVALAASTAIAAHRIAAMGSDNKLKILAANSAFDISGPILYVATAYSAANVTAAATRATNYTFWGSPFALTDTHAITGAAAGKPVYIVGTLSGNMFTPSSDVFTCTTPTSADNLVYMRLGIMSTAANAVLESQHPLYMYFNGAFQQCDRSTADAAKTATNYISSGTNGIKIANANPATATTYQHQTATSTEFVVDGNSMLEMDGTNGVRVGDDSGAHVLVNSSSLDIYNGSNVVASYSGNNINLGVSSGSSAINLCGYKGAIKWTNGIGLYIETDGWEEPFAIFCSEYVLRTDSLRLMDIGETFDETISAVDLVKMLTTESSTCAVLSGASSIGVNHIERVGKNVTITLATVKPATAIASNGSRDIATVPTGYRPSHNVYIPFMVYNNVGAFGYARIGSNGTVQIRNTSSVQITTAGEVCFTGTYAI